MKRRDGQAGFAFLEAAAALALSALVMLLMLTLGGLAMRNSEVTERHDARTERLATGMAALRREIESAIRVPMSVRPDAPVLFVGAADRMGFAVGRSDGGGDMLVMIETRAGEQGGTIAMVSRPLAPDIEGFAGGGWSAPVDLISGPWRFEFSYAVGGFGGLRWRESWSNPAALPAAVRMQVLGRDPGQRPVPPLVVPIRVDTEPPCAEEASARCRRPPDSDSSTG